MSVEADQVFRVQEPGFIWLATIYAAPGVHISGRDRYMDGLGHMLIRPMSLFTVADEEGREIDQATLLRYLAEIVWFPDAALQEYIEWEPVSDFVARATMAHGDVRASGEFTFSPEGDVLSFAAERYGEFNGEYRLETWVIPLSGHQEFSGVRVPATGDVTWRLAQGDYVWYRFTVQEIAYNLPDLFQH